MRDPLDDLAKPDGAEPDAGGGYDRPNQPWVCGNAESGCPCPFGPSPRGACPELAECRPVRDGDRWRCNRPARRGGPCDTDGDNEEGCGGPTPDGQCGRVHRCTPVRSLRTTRKRLAIGSGVFLAGVLAMLLGSGRGPMIAAPGPLTHAHARLMTETDVSRCARCHPGGGNTIAGHAAAALVGHGGATQSGLCMDCHEKQFDREHALLAHGLPAAAFADHGGAHESSEVACAACHREHHGAEHNLSAITNHRCQACHQERYDGLADHPDFGNWPYRRRTHIAFDHARHEGIHFAKAGAEFACSRCHADGANGAVATLGYEASCASCHDEPLRRSIADGAPVLALPMLDPVALADAGLATGPWSEDALDDFDGELPAPMKLLLAADPDARAAIDRLGADFTFFDVDPDSPDDVRDAATLANAIRQLVTDLAANGHAAIADRLPAAVPHPGKTVAGLTTAQLERLRGEWFEGRAAEGARPRREQAAALAAGGWFSDPATLSLRYAASGHADPVLTAWLEAAAALGDDQRSLRSAAFADLNRTGGCLDCHTVDAAPNGRLAINWRSLDTTITSRPFTRFAHTPHLTQPDLADCRGCHQTTEPLDGVEPNTGHDPRVFVSHFEPISKQACAGCHQPKLAGDGCTQCHNYHVDTP